MNKDLTAFSAVGAAINILVNDFERDTSNTLEQVAHMKQAHELLTEAGKCVDRALNQQEGTILALSGGGDKE